MGQGSLVEGWTYIRASPHPCESMKTIHHSRVFIGKLKPDKKTITETQKHRVLHPRHPQTAHQPTDPPPGREVDTEVGVEDTQQWMRSSAPSGLGWPLSVLRHTDF